jgi:hypothetical protein
MVLKVDEEPVEIAPLANDGEKEWREFLGRSDNGCLFHDLDFLAYHPPGRFRFRHLVARQRGKLLALIPGGLTGEPASPVFSSPLGASVGGPVIGPRTRTAQGIALVAALQDYATKEGWRGLQLTIAPAAYNLRTRDLLPFALFARGFRVEHRWNCYLVPIRANGAERYAELFRERSATAVRGARRAGVTASEGGVELLPEFLPLFRDTYQRHGAAPTHTPEEIADLLTRLPRQLSLVIARRGDIPLAGLLVMKLNKRVAYSFYICYASAREDEHGNLVAFAALLDILGAQGFDWLDTGPGAWDGNFNAGVVYFKEGIGGAGHCRDRWTWPAQAA